MAIRAAAVAPSSGQLAFFLIPRAL
jgi:hypothetical protein